MSVYYILTYKIFYPINIVLRMKPDDFLILYIFMAKDYKSTITENHSNH